MSDLNEGRFFNEIKEKVDESLSRNNADAVIDHIDFVEKYQEELGVEDEQIGKLHQIIAKSYAAEEFSKELNHYIRAIKYKPDNASLIEKYISSFISYLDNNKDRFIQKDLEIYFKEFERMKNYIEMKEGRDSKLFSLVLTVLEKVDHIYKIASDKEEGPLTSYTKKWRQLNNQYRPDEQALDYASQIIYEQYNAKT